MLVVSEQMWPEGGGGVLATHNILGLLRHFSEIKVLTGTKTPAKYVDVRYIQEPLLAVASKPLLNVKLFRSATRLKRYIRESDIVYIPRLSYPIISLAKKCDKRVIVHLHDYQPISYSSIVFYNCASLSQIGSIRNTVRLELMENYSPKKAIFSSFLNTSTYLNRLWLSQADDIICVSNRQREIIRSFAPELADKLRVVYNPLPKIPLTKKNPENSVFMYLGGDSYIKGFYTFLSASCIFLKKNPAAKFLLIGLLKNPNNIALVEGLNKRFNGAYKILGHIRHDEVIKLYSTSIALLFPSICEEPLPYAVLEAMQSGTIPIASNVGGVSEIVQGTQGEEMLFEPGNAEEMAERMENVLMLSKETIIKIGCETQQKVSERFSNDIIKKQLLEAFKLWN